MSGTNDSMVERVAQAIVESYSKHRPLGMLPWEQQPEFAKELARANARAAIEAMREPTDEMVSALEACLFEHLPEAREWTITMAREGARAMLTAALK